MTLEILLQVALPVNLPTVLDYLPLPDHSYKIGQRVIAPLGSRQLIGMITQIIPVTQSTVPVNKLKSIIQLVDLEPIFSVELLKLLHWASNYYHYPIGQVIAHAIPTRLSKVSPLATNTWPKKFDPDVELTKSNIQHDIKLELTIAQQQAISKIIENFSKFTVNLLEGITGSGKTEVYLRLIEYALSHNLQTVLLVPEIGLTPQTISRIQQRFPEQYIAVIHSKLTPREKFIAWKATQEDRSKIILGTRSACFVDLPSPGLFIIDEEHDTSYQQQEQFRYCARNFLIMRAAKTNIPIVLGSATPTLESFYNAGCGKFQHIMLTERANKSNLPQINLVDTRHKKLRYGFSGELIDKIKYYLEKKQQILIFLNRRGYAPVLLCNECDWQANCRHCAAKLTLHLQQHKLICHHCNARRAIPAKCDRCNSIDLIHVGLGTEQLEDNLYKLFPLARIIRIDQDTTTHKELPNLIDKIKNNECDIILGTQIISKGHHFPNLSLAVIMDLDNALFAVDYRATERMGQLLVQVAGRAGREQQQGEVIIQTRQPNNHLLQSLLEHDYNKFSKIILQERESTLLPPYSYQALISAQGNQLVKVFEFLNAIKPNTKNYKNLLCLGPAMSPLAKKSGQYRAQILLQSVNRNTLHQAVNVIKNSIYKTKIKPSTVKWAINIDPQDMY